jgi:hypothetical protein
MIHSVISCNYSQARALKPILHVNPPWIGSQHNDKDLICLGILRLGLNGTLVQTPMHHLALAMYPMWTRKGTWSRVSQAMCDRCSVQNVKLIHLDLLRVEPALQSSDKSQLGPNME